MMKAKYLIIGNSAGGIAAAEAIREVDKKGAVVIVTDEAHPAYSRPLIAKYLSGERRMENILFRPASFYEDNNITCLIGERVDQLGIKTGSARLENGRTIAWQKLLLATGGKPIVPRMKGMDKRGVFNFITLKNTTEIDGYLERVKRVVVIGGGLIGTSATEALVKRGIAVTVVEMKDRMLNTLLDEATSRLAEAAVEKAGVNIITGHTVTEVLGRDTVCGAVLDDGREIACEMVAVAIGVFPRVELTQGTEIKINRGIVVDKYMATNVGGVYACGDAAEAYDFVYGSGRLVPIWPNAYVGGRTAGYNMAGKKTEYAGGTAMNSINYFGLDIVTAGLVMPPDTGGYEVFTKQKDNVYQRVVAKDNRIVGMVFIGDIERSGIVFGLMRDRVDIGGIKEQLLADDFGLAHLPPELWRERLAVPVGARVVTSQDEVEEDYGSE
jgi:NAD(P)H-nitrite reductase large subunit